MAETLDDFLNQFIWEALFWSLLETLLAAAIVVWTIHQSKEYKYRHQDSKRSGTEEKTVYGKSKRSSGPRQGRTTPSRGF
jgi:hypothetical protein